MALPPVIRRLEELEEVHGMDLLREADMQGVVIRHLDESFINGRETHNYKLATTLRLSIDEDTFNYQLRQLANRQAEFLNILLTLYGTERVDALTSGSITQQGYTTADGTVVSPVTIIGPDMEVPNDAAFTIQVIPTTI